MTDPEILNLAVGEILTGWTTEYEEIFNSFSELDSEFPALTLLFRPAKPGQVLA
jgi:hypothetical protein